MENDINIIIGKNIRIRRKLMGFNQSALARRLGISYQQVQRYEMGRSRIAAGNLLILSRMLKCGIGEFFREPLLSDLEKYQ